MGRYDNTAGKEISWGSGTEVDQRHPWWRDAQLSGHLTSSQQPPKYLPSGATSSQAPNGHIKHAAHGTAPAFFLGNDLGAQKESSWRLRRSPWGVSGDSSEPPAWP